MSGTASDWEMRAMDAEQRLAVAREALTEVALLKLQSALGDRLNNHLVEMKDGYDDSITGFNEAWDVVTKFFEDKVAALKPKEPQT